MKNNSVCSRVLTAAFACLISILISSCGNGGGAETNPDGTIRAATFSKSFGTDLDDGAFNFIETQDGGYAVMGVVGGYLDRNRQYPILDVSFAPYVDYSMVGQMWFAKLDIDGNLQWEHRIDSEIRVVPTQILAVDQARSGEYCLVGTGSQVSTAAGPQPVDAMVMRLDMQGNVLWELFADSGGWPGFELAVSDGGLPESQDWLDSVVAGEDGSCTASGPSRANIVTNRDGNITTIRNALSSIVLSANSGQLRWLRREEATLEGDRSRSGTGRVFGNGNGEVVFIDEHDNASANKSILKVLRNDGSSRYSRVLDVALNDIRHAYFTDDPENNGQRDGQKNDGVLLSHGGTLTKLDRTGEIELQGRFGLALGTERSPQFAVQSCAATKGCHYWVIAIDTLTASSGVRSTNVNAYQLESNGGTVGEFQIVLLNDPTDEVYSLQVQEVDDGRINIVAVHDVGAVTVPGPIDRDFGYITTTQATLADSFSMSIPIQSADRIEQVPAGFVAISTGTGGALHFDSDSLSRYEPPDLSEMNVYNTPTSFSRRQTAGIAAIETSRNEFVVIGQSYNALVNESGVRGIIESVDSFPHDQNYAFVRAYDNVIVAFETTTLRVQADGTMTPLVSFDRFPGGAITDIMEFGSGWIVLQESTQSLMLRRLAQDGTRTLSMELAGNFGPFSPVSIEGSRPRITRLQNGNFVVAVPIEKPYGPVAEPEPEPEFHVELFVFDQNVSLLWSRGYRLPSASGRNIRIAGHPDGGIKLLATIQGARNYAVDERGFPVTGGLGGDNVMLMHIDATGDVVNAQLYGAGASESAESFAIAGDGGYLIAGRSDSLGVRSEAWVLRLGPNGEVTAGCNAQIGTIPGYVFDVVENAADTFPPPDTTLVLPPSDYSLDEPISLDLPVTANGELAEARQCFGTVSDEPLITPVNEPRTLTVNQAGSERGLILSTPDGIRCGINEGALCSVVRPTGSIVTLRVDDSDSVRFRGWGPQCADRRSNPYRCVVTLDFDTSIDVFFEADDGMTVNLATQVTGNGRILSNRNGDINCAAQGAPNFCSATYALGTPIELEISVTPPERFLGWDGDCAQFGSSQSLFLTMTADTFCSANFSGAPLPTRHTLQVALEVDGQAPSSDNPGGSVNSVPGGIVCSLPGTDCSEDYDEGTVVSLNAQALGGYEFLGWTSSDPSAGCHLETNFVARVTIDQTRNCTARFRSLSAQTYNMTITVLENNRVPVAGGPFGGRVTSSPAGFDCGPVNSDCFETFVDGTQVTLTPTPEPGYQFVGWGAGSGSGDCAPGSPAITTVTVDGNLGCIAMFDTIAGTGNNNVTVTFDAPATGARVVDVNTGTLDCTTTCTVSLPVNQSPIQLRPIDQGARWTNWYNCDAVIADPANPTGPMLCEIGIAASPRAVIVEFGL